MTDEKKPRGRPKTFGARPTWTVRLTEPVADQVRVVAEEMGINSLSACCELLIKTGLTESRASRDLRRAEIYIGLVEEKIVAANQQLAALHYQLSTRDVANSDVRKAIEEVCKILPQYRPGQ